MLALAFLYIYYRTPPQLLYVTGVLYLWPKHSIILCVFMMCNVGSVILLTHEQTQLMKGSVLSEQAPY